jgi:hypothetical protein
MDLAFRLAGRRRLAVALVGPMSSRDHCLHRWSDSLDTLGQP